MKQMCGLCRWMRWGGIAVLGLAVLAGWGEAQQDAGKTADEEMVIESEVSIENISRGGPLVSDGFEDQQEESEATKIDMQAIMENVELSQKQIIQLNRSLRKVIEENEKLLKQNRDLDTQLRNVRGQRTIEYNRLNRVSKEKDQLQSQLNEVSGLKTKFEQDMLVFERQKLEQKQDLETKIKDLQAKLEKAKEEAQVATMAQGYMAPILGEGVESRAFMQELQDLQNMGGKPQGASTVQGSQDQVGTQAETKEQAKASSAPARRSVVRSSQEVLDMIERIHEEKDRLKSDQARLHYNMGNKYVQLGGYRKAVREYERALDLTPENPNVHFNLAFVSEMYFRNYRKAMKHYRQYLVLNPTAEDADLVKEKIFEEELFIRSEIPADLEKEVVNHQRDSLMR